MNERSLRWARLPLWLLAWLGLALLLCLVIMVGLALLLVATGSPLLTPEPGVPGSWSTLAAAHPQQAKWLLWSQGLFVAAFVVARLVVRPVRRCRKVRAGK